MTTSLREYSFWRNICWDYLSTTWVIGSEFNMETAEAIRDNTPEVTPPFILVAE
jgi:hypothetical protein